MSPETKKTRTPKKAEEAAPKPVETAPEEQKLARRFREGVVVKDKMDKTRIVEVTRMIQHPQFKKIVRSKVKYAVHDEKNEAKAGDKVRIMETRPLSKTKRWRLVKVLGK